MEIVLWFALAFAIGAFYWLWQIKEGYRLANNTREAQLNLIRMGGPPSIILDKGVALVQFDDDRIRHMRDWLLRYAPATSEELDKLSLTELIEGFVAYHKVDNE